MPEVDRLNVKIEADASSLKKETKESVGALQRLVNAFNDVKNRLNKPIELNASQYSAQIAALEQQIADLKSLIDSDWGRQDMGREGVIKVQGQIERLTNQLNNLKKKQDEVNSNWGKGGSSLNGIISKVKRLALSIMGIRSIFSLISKSVNTYLSQNDALRKKLDGIYYAIGSMFAPILEWIVNLFAKIVLYVNAFLKGLGLSGIQFKNIQNSAQKTQKTMRTLISGFDELNTLQKQNEDGSSDNTLTDPFADVKVNQEWIDKLTSLGEKLRPIFEWLRDTLKALFDWVMDHIGLVIGALVAIKAIGLIAKVVELWGKLKIIFDAVKAFVSTAGIGAILKTIGGIGLIIGGLVLSVTQFVDMWKNGWNIIGEILKDLGLALAAIGAILLGAPAAVAGIVAGVVAVLSTLVIVVHEHWDEIVAWTKKLWENLKVVWEQIIATAKEAWTRFSQGIVEIVQTLMSELGVLWEDTKELCRNAWEAIKELANTIWTNIKDVIVQIVQLTKDLLVDIWNATKDAFSNVLNAMKDFASNAWNWIKNTVVNINNAIANSIKSIWNGISNTIKSVVNGIIGFINGMIRGITNGINAVINLLNKFSVDIPDWVPGFGGRHFGFNLRTLSAPQIPTLARGGVLKEPTLAMLGEYSNANNNPEIATPQNLLQDMFDSNNAQLVSSFAQMTQQIISAIEGVDMEVSIGDETIARSAARGNNTYKSMTGRSLITV